MLKTRVLTAIALLPVVLGMLFAAPPGLWAAFALAIVLLASWEWSRLCGFGPRARGAFLALSAFVAAALLYAYLHDPGRVFTNVAEAGFVAATYFWVFAVPLWLKLRLRPDPWVAGLAGLLALWPLWAALVVLRQANPWILLAIAALVWVADIAAYFAGRRYGRRKLAPAISPGKTWEGVMGALLGVLAYGVALDVFTHAAKGPIAPLFAYGWGVVTVFAMLVLAALSVLGDLFESWMKRCAGRKDSGSLLPGHGGILDRIDALTPTLPVAALLVSFA